MNLKGKKILITGVLNHRSIAYSIVKKILEYKGQIWITCQNEKTKKRIERQLKKDELTVDCISILDVTKKEDYDNLKKDLEEKWNRFDGFLHSIAFAQIDSFQKDFIELTSEEINEACNISATSLHEMTKKLKDLLNEESSIVSLSLDTNLVFPNYNAMAIAKGNLENLSKYLANEIGKHNNSRMNVIQSNPIKTIASSIIPKPEYFEEQILKNSMVQRTVTGEEVANLALFLFSDLSKCITAEVIAVDSGLKKKKLFEL